jgi:hypothetical protein
MARSTASIATLPAHAGANAFQLEISPFRGCRVAVVRCKADRLPRRWSRDRVAASCRGQRRLTGRGARVWSILCLPRPSRHPLHLRPDRQCRKHLEAPVHHGISLLPRRWELPAVGGSPRICPAGPIPHPGRSDARRPDVLLDCSNCRLPVRPIPRTAEELRDRAGLRSQPCREAHLLRGGRPAEVGHDGTDRRGLQDLRPPGVFARSRISARRCVSISTPVATAVSAGLHRDSAQ